MGCGGSVFEIDGIRFGLEICLDHAENRLKGTEGVSIQLVPSCGLTFEGGYKCIQHGLYFGVDASTPKCQLGVKGLSPTIGHVKNSCSEGGHIVIFDPVKIAYA